MTAKARVLTWRIRRMARRDLRLGERVRSWFRLWKRPLQGSGLLLVFLGLAAIAACRFASVDHGWKLGLLFLALFSLMRVLVAPFRYYNTEAASLALFPIGDEEIFRRCWIHHQRAGLVGAAAMCVWYAIMMFAAKGPKAQFADWIAVPLTAIGHEILLISLTAARTAWPAYIAMARPLGLPMIAALVLSIVFARALSVQLEPAIEWLLLIIPTGWISGAFLARITPTTVPAAVYIAGAAAALAGFPYAYAKLRREYAIREVEFHGTGFMRALGADEVMVDTPELSDEAQAQLDVISGAADYRKLAQALNETDEFAGHLLRDNRWASTPGRMEQFVVSRFSTRQRAIAEMLMSGTHSRTWGQTWQGGVKWLAILTAVVVALPLGTWQWLAFMPVVLVTIKATPALGGLWPGMNLSAESLTLTTLPAAYREVGGVMLLINRIRLLIWAPLIVAGCAVAGWKSGAGVGMATVIGAKVAYMIIVLQPLAVVYLLSQQVKDGSRFLGAIVNGFLVLVLICAMIASGVMLFVSDWRVQGLGAIGLILAVPVFLRFCYHRYECGRLDIGPKPEVPQHWG